MARYRTNDGGTILVPQDYAAPAAEAAAALTSPGFMEQVSSMLKGAGRKAGEGPRAWMQAMATPKNLLRGGIATAAIPAVMELADTSRPLDERGARAVGSVGGSLLAGIPTYLLAGGPANPLAPFIAIAASVGGSQAGAGLLEGGLEALKGSETDRATREYLKQQQAVATAKARELETLLPVQQQAAELALQNLQARNEIDSQRLRELASLQAMQDQQRGNQSLVSQMASSIIPSGGIGYGV
jgi:peptidyl-tRNA hydrolase